MWLPGLDKKKRTNGFSKLDPISLANRQIAGLEKLMLTIFESRQEITKYTSISGAFDNISSLFFFCCNRKKYNAH